MGEVNPAIGTDFRIDSISQSAKVFCSNFVELLKFPVIVRTEAYFYEATAKVILIDARITVTQHQRHYHELRV